MDQKAFGAFIAELRRAEKLTQRQVADKLHVTDRAVSKWERGLSYPDVTLFFCKSREFYVAFLTGKLSFDVE